MTMELLKCEINDNLNCAIMANNEINSMLMKSIVSGMELDPTFYIVKDINDRMIKLLEEARVLLEKDNLLEAYVLNNMVYTLRNEAAKISKHRYLELGGEG